MSGGAPRSWPPTSDHVIAVFAAVPALAEAQRWVQARFTTRPVRLRSPGQSDLLVQPDSGLALVPLAAGDLVVNLDPGDRLLVLWGRCPAALRSPTGDPETVDDLLCRLCTRHP